MSKKNRAKPGYGVDPAIKKQEGRALYELWVRRKRRTQAEFALDNGFTQGYVQQFFKGLRPLTLEMARRFADELEVDIAAFSPRLATEMVEEAKGSEWPFRGFTRAEYLTLSAPHRHAIEALALGFLSESGAVSYRKLRRVV